MQGVRRVRSRSIRGSSEIPVTFAPNTDMADALQQTQQRIKQARSGLPPGVDHRGGAAARRRSSRSHLQSRGRRSRHALRCRASTSSARSSRASPAWAASTCRAARCREVEVIADPARLATLGLELRRRRAGDQTRARRGRRRARDAELPAVSRGQTIGGATRPRTWASIVLARRGCGCAMSPRCSSGTEDRVRIVRGDGRPAALINISRQIGRQHASPIADSVASTRRRCRRRCRRACDSCRCTIRRRSCARRSVGARRDADRRGARRHHPPPLSAQRPHDRDQRVVDPAHDGDHRLPDGAARPDLQPDDPGRNGDRHRAGDRRRDRGHREHRRATCALTPDRAVAIRDAMEELVWPVTTLHAHHRGRVPPARLLHGRGGAVLRRALHHAEHRRARLAGARAHADPAARRPSCSREAEPNGSAGATAPQAPRTRIPARVGARRSTRLRDRYERALGAVLHHPAAAVGGGARCWWPRASCSALGGARGFLPEMDEGAFVLDYFTPGGTALAETGPPGQDRRGDPGARPRRWRPPRGARARSWASSPPSRTRRHRGAAEAAQPARSRLFAVIDDVRAEINRAAPRLHIEFVQILSDVINDLSGAPSRWRSSSSATGARHARGVRARSRPSWRRSTAWWTCTAACSDPRRSCTCTWTARTPPAGAHSARRGTQVAAALLGVTAGEVRSATASIGSPRARPRRVRFDPRRLDVVPIFGTGRRRPRAARLARHLRRPRRARRVACARTSGR